MKKVVTGLFLAVALFVLQACGGTPANTFEFVLDESYTEFVTMGTSADFQPFEYPATVDGKSTLVGIDIEIGKEIAKGLGKNLRVVNKNFNFLIEDLSNNKLDFVMAGLTITEDRSKKVDFSNFYYEAEDVLVVRKADQDKYLTIEDVNKSNIKIGAQSGTVQIDTVTEVLNNTVKHFIPNLQNLMNDLKNNKAHGVILDKPVAEAYVKQMTDLVISNVEFPIKKDKYAVAVNKGNSTLLNSINETIEDLKTSGKLEEIFKNILEII